MSIYLVCEGPADGLDVRVLDRVIVQKLHCNVQIEAAGGDRSLGSVATYLEQRYTARAFSIEDRNYHSMEEANETWTQSARTRLMWRRHEIENFLLDPRVVVRAFQRLSASGVRNAGNLPSNEGMVFDLLKGLAQPILEDHAGWLTYWSLDTRRSSEENNTRLKRPKDTEPPASPHNRYEWLVYLQAECQRLKRSSINLSTDPAFDDKAIVARYDEALANIMRPDYLNSGRFLLDLGGHQLLSKLMNYISQAGISGLSSDDLETELIEALDDLYNPGFFELDEFGELAARLQ